MQNHHLLIRIFCVSVWIGRDAGVLALPEDDLSSRYSSIYAG